MRVLIDTHVLVWWVGPVGNLSDRSKDVLADNSNQIFVSAVSAWEIALKSRIGKLHFNAAFMTDFDASIRQLAFTPISLTAAQMIAGAQIVSSHKDPFDRMLAGQAHVEHLAMMTADPAFATLGVRVLW